MPGILHESVILLISRAPQLLTELFGEALGLERDAEVVACDPVSHDPVTIERRADAVYQTRATDGPRVVILEVQLGCDEEKREVWPYYPAAERLRQHCPTSLAVFAPEPAVAAWAARPIVTGQPGCDFRAAVVDGRGVPWVTEPDAEVPERVVLSAIIHGDEPGGERVVAAAVATLRIMVDEDRRSQYYWLLWECSGDAMRRRLEELMDIGTVLAQTTKGRELIAQGEAQGEARGKEIGKEIGEAIGEARGFTTALFAVLEARGLAVSEAQRARVLACEDPAVLQRWVTRAATAATTADALE